MLIKIDGHILEVHRVFSGGYLPMVETEDGDYYLAEDAETAGAAAREYWADMAANDPAEFACVVGESTLIAWALGQSAGPGHTKVRSLEEWLDLVAAVPEEEWGQYDGSELDVDRAGRIVDELGFTPTVAYRCN